MHVALLNGLLIVDSFRQELHDGNVGIVGHVFARCKGLHELFGYKKQGRRSDQLWRRRWKNKKEKRNNVPLRRIQEYTMAIW